MHTHPPHAASKSITISEFVFYRESGPGLVCFPFSVIEIRMNITKLSDNIVYHLISR